MRDSISFQQMNEWQQEAILRTKGPLLVTAGPGSGKTRVITYRVLNLLEYEQVSPQRIYVITFTKDAAQSMSARFYEINRNFLSEASYQKEQVFFGTYHSLFFQIIKSHVRYENIQFIGEEGKKSILANLWKKRTGEACTGRMLQKLVSDISYYKNTDDAPGADFSDFLPIARDYELEKNRLHCIDYDDMILVCKDLLEEDEAFRRHWQEKMEYILVDEFQDTSNAQYDVLKLLGEVHRNVCVVGDDDQSIYGFRGANPGICRKFMEDYADCRRIHLAVNYRSKPDIVRRSKSLICHNKERIAKEQLPAAQGNETCIFVRGFEDRESMNRYILSEFRCLDREKLNDCAVLFRTNQSLHLFAAALMREQIPFVASQLSGVVYDHFVAKDIMDYLKVAHGYGGREALMSVLNKPRTLIGREALRDDAVTPQDIVRYYEARGSSTKVYADALRFATGMRILQGMELSQGITFIYRYFGYEAYLIRKCGKDRDMLRTCEEVMEFLVEEAKLFRDVLQWEVFWQECRMKMQRIKAYAKQKKAHGVRIMTIHGAKGLEFERVFLYEVNEENMPKIRKGEILSNSDLEEERRLFYVGMTRAKEALELLYTTGTKSARKPPSRFLKELED